MEIIRSTTLKPLASSPQLNTTAAPLTVFDRSTFNLHVPHLFAYHSPTPTNQALTRGLSKALLLFPHLAGRLASDDLGLPCIALNNNGVRLVETYVPKRLEEFIPFDPSSVELGKFYPDFRGVQELIQVQLNRFSCGGLILGFTLHHRVCDGQSKNTFLRAWSNIVRGVEVDMLPYHDRAAVSAARKPLTCDLSRLAAEFGGSSRQTPPTDNESICNLFLRFSPEFLEVLRSKVISGDVDCHHRHTTFQCLLAHMWKKLTLARGLDADELTGVRVAVDCRRRMNPPVPLEYFGNFVMHAYPRMPAGELLKESYAGVARIIREAVMRIDDECIRSFIDYGELYIGGGAAAAVAAPGMGSWLWPDLEVDSWLSFMFHQLDFGGGRPCALLSPNVPVEGLMLFVPAVDGGGGVDVTVAVSATHADNLRKISHCLD